MMDEAPVPHLTPMSHEGVLIEWNVGGIRLEIEIETPGEACVTYEDDHQEAGETTWLVRTDFRSLSSPIEELARHRSTRVAS